MATKSQPLFQSMAGELKYNLSLVAPFTSAKTQYGTALDTVGLKLRIIPKQGLVTYFATDFTVSAFRSTHMGQLIDDDCEDTEFVFDAKKLIGLLKFQGDGQIVKVALQTKTRTVPYYEGEIMKEREEDYHVLRFGYGRNSSQFKPSDYGNFPDYNIPDTDDALLHLNLAYEDFWYGIRAVLSRVELRHTNMPLDPVVFLRMTSQDELEMFSTSDYAISYFLETGISIGNRPPKLEERSWALPRKAVKRVHRMFKDVEDIHLYFYSGGVLLSSESFDKMLYILCEDRDPPAIETILEEKPWITLDFDRKAFIEALKNVMVVNKEYIWIRVGKHVIFSAYMQEFATATRMIDLQKFPDNIEDVDALLCLDPLLIKDFLQYTSQAETIQLSCYKKAISLQIDKGLQVHQALMVNDEAYKMSNIPMLEKQLIDNVSEGENHVTTS